jgi:hypothetical protein
MPNMMRKMNVLSVGLSSTYFFYGSLSKRSPNGQRALVAAPISHPDFVLISYPPDSLRSSDVAGATALTADRQEGKARIARAANEQLYLHPANCL